MSVSVENRQRRLSISTARLGKVGASALSMLKRSDWELHVTVVGDAEIQRLHERYLGERGPTDVLAFNLEAPGPTRLLGEVIISADTAAHHAARLHVSLALELDLLLVHGLLHLVGYDDHDPRAARRMHERARKILTQMRRRPLPARLFTGLLEPRRTAARVRPLTSCPPRRSASRSRRTRRDRHSS